MIELLTAVVVETARVVYESSLYILLGFFIAGLFHEFLPTRAIARHLGRDNARSVGLAALFGAPIPLCSCGVLPAAAELRRKGASRSSILSFLISTPETGVDSIALTYGLIGPVMAIVRPLAAILSGCVAGLVSIAAGERRRPGGDEAAAAAPGGGAVGSHSDGEAEAAADGSGGGSAGLQPPACCVAPAPEDDERAATGDAGAAPRAGRAARTRHAIAYGFGGLLDELAFWLVIGIVLTGILSALIPDGFFSDVLGWDRGLLPMLAMIVAGVPLYLCASASTPIAAALIAKGLSPGAALVFLLVGPATNAATMTVVGHELGLRRLRIYLGSIVGVSLAAGLLLDAFGGATVRAVALGRSGEQDPQALAAIKVLASFAFVFLLVVSYRRRGFREGWHETREQFVRLGVAARAFRWRRLASAPALVTALVLLAIAVIPRCVLVVEPGQRGIVQRFGRVVGAGVEPGLYVHWPPPIGRGTAVDVDLVRQVDIGFAGVPGAESRVIEEEAYYLTADENIIDVRAVLHYRVTDPVRYALGVEDAGTLITSLGRRDLVEIASHASIDQLYTTERAATEARLRETLHRQVAALAVGCEVIDARLLDVHAPAAVHEAFRDVASALEDRERSVHEANGYAAEVTARATGEATAIVETARSDSSYAINLASGKAEAFRGIAAVHAGHPAVTETRLYLETMEAALVKPRKYVNGTTASAGEVDLWIGDRQAPPAEWALPAEPAAPGRQRQGGAATAAPRGGRKR